MTNQLLITTVLDSNPFCRFPLIINFFLGNNKLKDAPPSSRLLTQKRNRIETDRSYLRFFEKKKKDKKEAPDRGREMETTSSSSSSSSPSAAELISKSKRKEALGWMEWLRGWLYVIYEMLFQRILASHLQNPLPLPPVNDLTCIVTGSTSGIGREIARYKATIFKLFNFSFSFNFFIVFQLNWNPNFSLYVLEQAIGRIGGSCCYGSEELKGG